MNLTKSELERIYKNNGGYNLVGDRNSLLLVAANMTKQLNIAAVLQQVQNHYTNSSDTFAYDDISRLIQDYVIKSDYSSEGKENLRKSMLANIFKDAEWLYKNVVEVLQPSKTTNVIRLKDNTARTKGFEMQVGPVLIYMDKTSFLKAKLNSKHDDSLVLE